MSEFDESQGSGGNDEVQQQTLQNFMNKALERSAVSCAQIIALSISSLYVSFFVFQMYQRAAKGDKDKKKGVIEELEAEIGKEKFQNLLQASREELESSASMQGSQDGGN